nr:immunoglobulin light chain junction region [Macaca mulatta]MOW74584.1 immunoglobulin light chain junction region [Macaca mulatta]
CLQYFSAPYSF